METMIAERASVVGEELADFARACRENGGSADRYLLGAIDRMFAARVEDETDALASIAVAQLLIGDLHERGDAMPEDERREIYVAIYGFLRGAIGVLENTTGRKAAEFTSLPEPA